MDRYQTRTAPTDAVLVSQTRRGDHHAYRTLVARHHEAVRLAALLLGGPSTLVRATFDAAHGCLVRDAGSAGAVRPYLLQLAHRLHQAPDPVDDLVRGDAVDCTPFRESVPTAHPSLAAEVSWLPHSWQAVLWHRLVERDGDDAVAAAVGVPPGKVPLLVDGGLDLIRRNLVARHRKGSPPQCLAHGLRLERSNGGVPRAVLRHAHECARCARLLDDLAAVDTALPRVMAEALLGEAGVPYLAARGSRQARPAGYDSTSR